jgi:GNAT superfamily N-acetyltransferase
MIVEIRPYRDADHAEVARVWYESALSSMSFLPARPNLRAELFERIPREIASGWSLYVAPRDNRVIGMLALILREKRLHQLFVDPSFQNNGVGITLLEFTKSMMTEGFWLTTMSRNEGARRFYEREGLAHKGDRPHPNFPNEMHSVYVWPKTYVLATEWKL